MVAQVLDGLTTRHGACRIVAYADLSSNLVLVTNSGVKAPREALDALCGQAADAFAKPPIASPESCDVAIIAHGAETLIYLRHPVVQTDALCCVCGAGIDLPSFVQDARDCLGELTGPRDGAEAAG
ncbi:MAG: hypothetical protein AAF919_15280 [Pseudomonadota bacterium]